MPDANITKSALARAMKKLMNEKGFQKISVTDICESCGMNRKSFYYHFKDKYDLMNWIFYTDFITMITSEEIKTGWDLLTSVITLFYNDQSFYRAAMKTDGQNSFREYFRESMLPIAMFTFSDAMEDWGISDTMINIVCDTCLTASMMWLDNGCRETPEEFVQGIKRVVLLISNTIDADEVMKDK